ncbi:ATP-binding protein [Heliophilum fasciatum]|uniref:Uncharacterized protein YPO0396 n=1 Tax=Heliophilum fasciatum TaxID=35700 RepID=A0A4R2RIK4_9FIRM|nr:SbcC/MukB-like Walker B domain-containing protein [Heliophilum fasciatum]MCW2278489.1 uncharacterized protein YPO0396 [Heliophilum fasciatum]TCP63620.1 uncharacterized protein YPO0396 [Heliophilum fasciatum]
MKWMRKLRLINWHYFQDETMAFGSQTLISGRNSAGKSTIIDALQVIFIADQRQIRFNSAAHDEARRSLLSYLRGKIGSDDQRHVRENDFTSYVVAEFYDEKKRETFVIGAVFDVYGDNSIVEEFFIIPGAGVESLAVRDGNGKLRNRDAFRRHYQGAKTFFERSKSAYQKALLQRMGQVHDRFFSNFVRALSFKPIHNVRDFVFDFILDERELQLDLMKENFRIHENYQRELTELQARRDMLQTIAAQFATCQKLRERVREQEYVIRRLRVAEQEELLAQATEQAALLDDQIRQKASDLVLAEEQQREAADRAKEAYMAWQGNEQRQRQVALKAELAERQKQADEHRRMLQVLRDGINRQYRLVTSFASWGGNSEWQWTEDDQAALVAAEELLAALLGDLEGAGSTAEEKSDALAEEKSHALAEEKSDALAEVGDMLAQLQDRLTKTVGRIEDRLAEMEQRKQRLQQQIADLENQKRPYDRSLLALKKLLEERLAGRSPVWIFCEEAEIADEAWRNAVEGYLHTQRFDLLVEPAVFAEALALYEQEKWRLKLEGVGLVDTEKEQRYLGKVEPGSLAEVMRADHPVIQARIAHLLGRVFKANDEQDLRRHAQAVTASCMTYTNLVARQMPKSRYEVPYIGARAIVRQLELKRAELAALEQERASLAAAREELARWAGQLSDQRTRCQQLAGQLHLPRLLAAAEREIETLAAALAQLDLSDVERLEQEYKRWHGQEQTLLRQIRELERAKSQLETAQQDVQRRCFLTGQEVKKLGRLVEDWITEHGPEHLARAEERWLEAAQQEAATANKISNWLRNQQGNETKRQKEAEKLRDARKEYNLRYTYSADVGAEDNEAYRSLLDHIDAVDIPDYQGKLTEALRQSEEEFKSHFIFKLREAIEQAKRDFQQLNYALKHFPFHEDHYYFEVKASEKYKRFYEAIMDPEINERGSLFDGGEEKAQVLHELFERLIRGEVGEQAEFTDYRRYLDFDIRVTSRGTSYKFSQVLKEKSGGETQTPFYIAILASFNHLYASNKTMRLVVFDEAFNKMDEERIQTSLRLIKRMNLQLIAAVPDEKMQHMAPEVTTTLVVNRDGYVCFVDMIGREEVPQANELISGDGDAEPGGAGEGEAVSTQDSLFSFG